MGLLWKQVFPPAVIGECQVPGTFILFLRPFLIDSPGFGICLDRLHIRICQGKAPSLRSLGFAPFHSRHIRAFCYDDLSGVGPLENQVRERSADPSTGPLNVTFDIVQFFSVGMFQELSQGHQWSSMLVIYRDRPVFLLLYIYTGYCK